MSSNVKQRIVVVGNGMVGHHFVDQLANSERKDEFEVSVLSAEPRLAYDRVHLSEFFAGKSADELAMTSESYYSELGVSFFKNAKVKTIDRNEKYVITEAGERFDYDKLVLATGSYPFVPPIPGKDQDHCLVYRTIEDLEAMTATAKVSKRGVVIGGGLLGLEAANALKNLGLETHVVEFAPQLMPTQIDLGGGTLLRDKIAELGVTVHTGKATSIIDKGQSSRYVLKFNDGDELETDMVLFSAGIRPHDELAREFELEVGERGGIVINDQCQTTDENVYAIGECALWGGKIFGLVAPGYRMAEAAVSNLTHGDLAFTGADMSTKLKLLGVEVGSIGDAHGRTPGAVSYTYINQREQVYKKLVVSSGGKELIGSVLVGDTSDYDTLLQYALNGIELPENPESLILPDAGGAPALGADALPDTATICSCLNVTKGDIKQAVADGAMTVADVKGVTQASTGCGL